MNSKLLNYFETDLSFMEKSPNYVAKATKKDKDIYILERVVKNALALNTAYPEAKSLKERLQNYLIKNIAQKGIARHHLSEKTLNLSKENIMDLSDLNSIIVSELKVQATFSHTQGRQA